jgi:tetratricopeptide (TPR) repeat protein
MKKNYYLLFLLGFLFTKSSWLISQTSYTKDTTRLLVFLNRGETIYNNKLDSSVIYWNSGLKLAEDILKKNPSKSEFVLKVKSVLLNNIGYSEMIYGRTNEALRYFDSCSTLQVKLKLWGQYANTINNTANIYLTIGKSDEAIKLFQKSIKIFTNNDYDNELSSVYSNLGLAYKSSGDYIKAIEYLFKAEKYADKYKNNSKTEIYLNIADLFLQQNDSVNHLRYSKAAISEGIKNSEYRSLSFAYLNLGKLYIYNNKQLAHAYYLKSLGYAKKAQDPSGLANCLYNIAALTRSDSSEALYQQSKKIYLEINNPEGAAYCDLALVYYLTNNNKYKEAEDLLLNALSLFEKNRSIEGIKRVDQQLYSFYKKRKLTDLALKYYEKFVTLKDSMNNVDLYKKTLQKDVGYDFEKKEIKLKADHLLKEQLLLKEKKNQRNIIYSIVVIFVLLLVFSIIIFKNLQDKRKINKIILSQKALVEEKQKEILDSIKYAKRIQQTLLPSEKYVERNLRRLRGNSEEA